MEIKDWVNLIVSTVAVLLSPLVAVQVTEWLRKKGKLNEEKINLFKTLMATRAANLNPRHVEALNLIDVVFMSESKQDKDIRAAWKAYLDHLNNKSYQPKEGWDTKRVELLVVLLHKMALTLGFDFDQIHIKNHSYFPQGYSEIEMDNSDLRKGVLDIVLGRRSLPTHITSLPNQELKDNLPAQ